MQLALREISRYRVPLMIWMVATAVAAVAGPFGTLDAMGPGARAFYWGGVSAISITMSFGAQALAQRYGTLGRIGVWTGFVLVIAGLSHLINTVLFDGWGGWADWAYLTGTVWLVTISVYLIVAALTPAVSKKPDDTFMRRLPIDVRGPLVRIEAQDHYLNLVTARGSTLILMRLSEAIAELAEKGLQVHRSHWIAEQAVAKHRREGGRDVLVMADGVDVPVSRSFRKAAQEAGLF
jgi:hypothetical protein